MNTADRIQRLEKQIAAQRRALLCFASIALLVLIGGQAAPPQESRFSSIVIEGDDPRIRFVKSGKPRVILDSDGLRLLNEHEGEVFRLHAGPDSVSIEMRDPTDKPPGIPNVLVLSVEPNGEASISLLTKKPSQAALLTHGPEDGTRLLIGNKVDPGWLNFVRKPNGETRLVVTNGQGTATLDTQGG